MATPSFRRLWQRRPSDGYGDAVLRPAVVGPSRRIKLPIPGATRVILEQPK
jgi:hypothetical protein